MSSTAASTNGATETIIVSIPAQLSVVLAGATITADAAPTKAKGDKPAGVWFQAKMEAPLPEDSRSVEDILGGLVGRVLHEGEPMQLGSKYRGVNGETVVVQVAKMGRGGRATGISEPTIVFVKGLHFGDLNYTMFVTCKIVAKSAGRVLRVTFQAQKKPEPGAFQQKGHISGELSL